MTIETVTIANIRDLEWARAMAEDWRGNHHPDDYEEFDGWIDDVNRAIKAVKRDRKRLRAVIAYIEANFARPSKTLAKMGIDRRD